eukprot:1967624-Pleurochrysis_carterae.AAC.1
MSATVKRLAGSVRRRVGVLEGQKAAEHREEADAERPDVGARALVALACHHLGRGVAGRAAGGAQQPVGRVEHGGEAEVDHLDVAVLVNEQVLGLEVTMGYAHRVAGVDAQDDLPEDLARLRLVQPAMRDDKLEQLAAREEFGDQVDVLGLLDHLEQLHDVGVAHDENETFRVWGGAVARGALAREWRCMSKRTLRGSKPARRGGTDTQRSTRAARRETEREERTRELANQAKERAAAKQR